MAGNLYPGEEFYFSNLRITPSNPLPPRIVAKLQGYGTSCSQPTIGATKE